MIHRFRGIPCIGDKYSGGRVLKILNHQTSIHIYYQFNWPSAQKYLNARDFNLSEMCHGYPRACTRAILNITTSVKYQIHNH